MPQDNSTATITVAGFASCPYHQKALAAAKSMVAAGKFSSLDDKTMADRDTYKAWLASDARPTFTDERAQNHTSSPFVFIGSSFVGGCDDTIAMEQEGSEKKTGIVSWFLGLVVGKSDAKGQQPAGLGDNVISYSFRLGIDVSIHLAIMIVIYIVSFIPPLRAFLLTKVAEKMKEIPATTYDEVNLIDNIFNAPVPFVKQMYRWKRQARLTNKSLAVGDAAPNPALYDAEDGSSKHLFDYAKGDRPMVLNFGSQSCGCFAASVPMMNEIMAQFRSDVDFISVYTTEAHPVGGWEAPDQPNLIADATTTAERLAAARAWFEKTKLSGKLAVDGIDNEAQFTYDTMPDRIFVVQKGKVLYMQEKGPFGYLPVELTAFLQKMK